MSGCVECKKYREEYKLEDFDFEVYKDGKCIFHCDNKDKDKDKFLEALAIKKSSIRNRFFGFIFPKDIGIFYFDSDFYSDSDFYFDFAVFNCKVNFSDTTFDNKVNFLRTKINNKVSFSDTTFSNEVDFSGKTFKNKVNFLRTTFNNEVNFSDTTFNNEVNFSGTNFSDEVNFSGTTFNNKVNFTDTTFKNEVDFTDITFNNEVNFTDITFNNEVNFSDKTFNYKVNFLRITFDNKVNFSDKTFNNEVDFTDTTFSNEVDFSGKTFNDKVNFLRTTFNNKVGFIDTKFNDEVNFTGTTFDNKVYFLRTTFSDEVNFLGTTFNEVIFKNLTSSKDLKFRLSNSSAVELVIDNLDFISDDISFQNINIKEKIQIKNTMFTKENFFNIDLSESEKVIIENSSLNDNFLQNVIWGQISEDIIVSNRDTFRKIKASYEQQKSFINANAFYVLEMIERAKELQKTKWYDDISDKAIFYTYKISSNFSQNIILPIYWLFIVGMMGFMYKKTNIEISYFVNIFIYFVSYFVLRLIVGRMIYKYFSSFTKYIYNLSLMVIFVCEIYICYSLSGDNFNFLDEIAKDINPLGIVKTGFENTHSFLGTIYRVVVLFLIYQLIVVAKRRVRNT